MPVAPFAPDWTIELVDRPEWSEVIAALLCMTSDGFATRATSELRHARAGARAVRVGGVWGVEPPGALAAGPSWLPTFAVGEGRRWRLDMYRGVVEHEVVLPDGQVVRTLRFASLARSRTGVFWVAHLPAGWTEQPAGCGPIVLDGESRVAVVGCRQQASDRSLLRVAVAVDGQCTGQRSVEALSAMAMSRAADAARAGAPNLLAEHEAAWARRWETADIALGGDGPDQLALRFALFHLLSLTTDADEAGLGARGLTGDAYAGHVFWDADVHVLPVLAALHPATARAMVRYRVARLDAARRRAASEGRPGARYPWESAGSGDEVTPTEATALDGTVIPILSGVHELHINPDIAWAAHRLGHWCGDDQLLTGDAGELVTETARYLESRIEQDDDASAHLRGVMGPDEYHERVDDNAYTNRMVAWHLRCAAGLTADPGEADRWRQLGERLVDGFRPAAGRYEQFAGFDDLEPVLIDNVASTPVAADVLLGRAVVARSQIVKQADVIMLHHMLPDEMITGSLDADLAYYLPRTAHGSSLSPAIHASVLARAGRPEEAHRWLRIALRMDLDDLTGTTAGGVHVGTMGGVWQAVAFGYLGLSVGVDGSVGLDPCVPADWPQLEVHLQVRGRTLTVRVGGGQCEVTSDGPLAMGAGAMSSLRGAAPRRHIDHLVLSRGPRGWEESI